MLHINNLSHGRQVQITPTQINEVIANMTNEMRLRILQDYIIKIKSSQNQANANALAAAAAAANSNNAAGRAGMNAPPGVGGMNMATLTPQQINMMRANAILNANANIAAMGATPPQAQAMMNNVNVAGLQNQGNMTQQQQPPVAGNMAMGNAGPPAAAMNIMGSGSPVVNRVAMNNNADNNINNVNNNVNGAQISQYLQNMMGSSAPMNQNNIPPQMYIQKIQSIEEELRVSGNGMDENRKTMLLLNRNKLHLALLHLEMNARIQAGNLTVDEKKVYETKYKILQTQILAMTKKLHLGLNNAGAVGAGTSPSMSNISPANLQGKI
jgi:hypothetical protein